MLVITAEFLHGILRTGSAEGLALTGQDDPGEWPPSPARLFAALVAADGTGPRCRVTDGSELGVLESAPPPQIHADSAGAVLRSTLLPRFVVVDSLYKGAVQNYPARKSTEVRPGSRLSPKHPHIAYVWPTLELSSQDLQHLQRRAARVGYLGCADSPVRLQASGTMPAALPDLPVWEPSSHSGAASSLGVPYAGFTAALDRSFERWSSGVNGTRVQVPMRWERYGTPDESGEPAHEPHVFWLTLHKPLPAHRLLALTTTLRDTVLSHFGEGRAPLVLHGHGGPGEGHSQARFLGLPEAGYRHARGYLRGAAVWLPPDTDLDVVAQVRAALAGVRRLVRGSALDVGISPYDGSPTPVAMTPPRWRGPSRHWVSVSPVVFERRPKVQPTRRDVASWCAHGGIEAEVEHFRLSRVPLADGAADLRPTEVFRPGKARYPYAHLSITFGEEITGPVALGRARQLGMGLMLPTRGER